MSKRLEGLQDPRLEAEKCPRCLDELLIRAIGNVVVCPNCDIILLDEQDASLDLGQPNLEDKV